MNTPIQYWRILGAPKRARPRGPTKIFAVVHTPEQTRDYWRLAIGHTFRIKSVGGRAEEWEITGVELLPGQQGLRVDFRFYAPGKRRPLPDPPTSGGVADRGASATFVPSHEFRRGAESYGLLLPHEATALPVGRNINERFILDILHRLPEAHAYIQQLRGARGGDESDTDDEFFVDDGDTDPLTVMQPEYDRLITAYPIIDAMRVAYENLTKRVTVLAVFIDKLREKDQAPLNKLLGSTYPAELPAREFLVKEYAVLLDD